MSNFLEESLTYGFRVFVLILLPFIIGAYFLPHEKSITGDNLTSPVSGLQNISSKSGFTFVHTIDNAAIPQKLSSIFPLADYLSFPPFVVYKDPVICFEDKGTYITFLNGSKSFPDLIWIVDVNNKTKVIVPKNSVSCTTSKANEKFDYIWTVNVSINSDDPDISKKISLNPQTATYPMLIVDYGLLQGLVSIPVFFLFVWYPLFGIIKKIKSGLGEQ
ncbi:MAG: hypothetical protein AABX38_07800 [Candidatus Micrarchaeota archaeon]